MKCASVNKHHSQTISAKSFKGMPARVPVIEVKNWKDAVKSWNFLKDASYLDTSSDKLFPQYKQIRMENYSFLEKLTSNDDKASFVEKFCEFTKFPNLNAVSQQMNEHFTTACYNVSKKLGRFFYDNPYKVFDTGYDPTCSLGLKKAFPGSDLDKGYVILEGSSYPPHFTDKELVDNFKIGLWNEMDNRIISQTHPETEIEVYTKCQVINKLADLNTAARSVLSGLTIPKTTFLRNLLGLSKPLNKYEKIKNSEETDPYKAAKFNRDLVVSLLDIPKEDAKNFAFFIETVDANRKKYSCLGDIFTSIANSSFVRNSNITQIPAWQKKIANGYMKTKLKHRENLQTDFYTMSTDEKYNLVKEVIKSASQDQSGIGPFAKYFNNDDNISDRYKDLLKALK